MIFYIISALVVLSMAIGLAVSVSIRPAPTPTPSSLLPPIPLTLV